MVAMAASEIRQLLQGVREGYYSVLAAAGGGGGGWHHLPHVEIGEKVALGNGLRDDLGGRIAHAVPSDTQPAHGRIVLHEIDGNGQWAMTMGMRGN